MMSGRSLKRGRPSAKEKSVKIRLKKVCFRVMENQETYITIWATLAQHFYRVPVALWLRKCIEQHTDFGK